MLLKFDSKYFFNNLNRIKHAIDNDVMKSYVITKDVANLFELNENEVVFLRIIGSKFIRNYKTHHNQKYGFLSDDVVNRTPRNNSEYISTIIYLTSKYVHLKFGDHHEKILITNIKDIYISETNVAVFLEDKAYEFVFNSLAIALQFALIIDVTKHIKIGDQHVGQAISIGLGNQEKNIA